MTTLRCFTVTFWYHKNNDIIRKVEQFVFNTCLGRHNKCLSQFNAPYLIAYLIESHPENSENKKKAPTKCKEDHRSYRSNFCSCEKKA